MKIIALEGIDGSGKTTLVNKLKEYFKDKICVSFEFDSEIGNVILENLANFNPIEKTLLFATDRVLRIEKLKNCKIVVFDRYIYSAYVYREAEKFDLDYVEKVNSIFKKPDLNIYLDVSIEDAFKRKKITYSKEFLRKCRKIYLDYVNKKELIEYKGFEWLVKEIEKLLEE